jgi:hypothetical protein
MRIVAAADEQEPAGRVEDDGAHARHDRWNLVSGSVSRHGRHATHR